ncbi:MAG: SH3 domain-containing protein [Clostridiales bacterium]|nr:SH3 domain-containing protein [Clostridiales bacterium]
MKRVFCLTLLAVLAMAMFAAPALAVVGYAVKTTASVNLRKGPGLGYGIITSVSSGKSFTYTGVSQFDGRGIAWHRVSYNDSTAWISWKYSNLTYNGSAISESKCVQATASVNVRKGAGISYEKLTTVSSGRKLVYLFESKVVSGRIWYKVSCSQGIGWISSAYSKLVNPTSSTTQTVVTTGSVYLRKGPGLSYGIITSASEGKEFDYLSYATDGRGVKWYKVTYASGTAWISSKYSKIA